MATKSKLIAKNTLFLYVRMFIVMIVSIYTSRVILETLGIVNYGIYNVVGGIATMMSFVNMALGVSTSRHLTFEIGTGNDDKLKKIFAASLNLHIGIACITLILAETIGLWFFYEKLVIPSDRIHAAFWVYQFSIVTTMLSFTQVPYSSTLLAHENMSIYAYLGLYETFSKLIIVYLISIFPIDRLIQYAFLLMLNSLLIQFFLRFFLTRKYSECRYSFIVERKFYKPLLSYSGWNLIGGLSYVIQNQGVNMLLNMFAGPTINAARGITYQIQNAMLQFVYNFLTAVRPQVVKEFAQENYKNMYKLTFVSGKFSAFLFLAISLPICFELDYILKLWLGENIPQYTSIFTQLVIWTTFIELFCNIINMPYGAIGIMKFGNIIGSSIQILILPIGYLLLKFDFSPCFVFIAILFNALLKTIFMWVHTHNLLYFKWKSAVNTMFIPVIIVGVLTIVIPSIIMLNMNEGLNRFLIQIFSIEILLIINVCCFGMNKNERATVSKYIKRKLFRE